MDRRTRSLLTRVGIGLAGLTTAAAVAVPLGTSKPEGVHSRPASHVQPGPQQAAIPTDPGAQAPQQLTPAVPTDTGLPSVQQEQVPSVQQGRQGTTADSNAQPAQRQPEIATPPGAGCTTVDANGVPLFDSQYEQRTGHAPC